MDGDSVHSRAVREPAHKRWAVVLFPSEPSPPHYQRAGIRLMQTNQAVAAAQEADPRIRTIPTNLELYSLNRDGQRQIPMRQA
jgi:hypothetical protein